MKRKKKQISFWFVVAIVIIIFLLLTLIFTLDAFFGTYWVGFAGLLVLGRSLKILGIIFIIALLFRLIRVIL